VWETYLSAAFLRVKDPFDNLPFLLCVAQTFGGQVNLQAMQVIDMLVLTFKVLASTDWWLKCISSTPSREAVRPTAEP